MSPRIRKTTPEQAATRRISKAEHVPGNKTAKNRQSTLNLKALTSSRYG
jgi:hypothetical protein